MLAIRVIKMSRGNDADVTFCASLNLHRTMLYICIDAHLPRAGREDTCRFIDIVQTVPEDRASHELGRKRNVVPVDDNGNA